MKILISISAWIDLPSVRDRRVLAKLPDGFSVVTLRNPGQGNVPYFLLDGAKQAGSAVLVRLGAYGKFKESNWIDVVYLEPEYRGKNYMRNLLWFVVRDIKIRPIFLDAHRSNPSTYVAVGFRPMTKKELAQYALDIKRHRQTMSYDRPLSEYIPLILE